MYMLIRVIKKHGYQVSFPANIKGSAIGDRNIRPSDEKRTEVICYLIRLKKCYVSDFPTDWSKSAPTATFLALRKKKSRRPTLFNDSGFYQKSKPFRYENLSAPIFGYFRSLTITIKNNNMATV